MTATRHGRGERWQKAGFLFLALALVSGGCDRNPGRARAEKRLVATDLAQLRFDAALTYKNAFAARGPQLVTVSPNTWPSTFRSFSPLRVTAYRDGIAVALAQLADRESGLWIIPKGMTHDPAATPRATFEELRDGVYWYEFGQAE